MKNRSTATKLSEFVHYSMKAFSAGAQIDVLYTDFSKAFDRIDYSSGIYHLIYYYGLRYIYVIVSNLCYMVAVNHMNSMLHIRSSSRKSYYIGRTLFLIFVDNIVGKLEYNVFVSLFSDDLRIVKVIKSTDDSNILQNSMNIQLSNISKLKIFSLKHRHIN